MYNISCIRPLPIYTLPRSTVTKLFQSAKYNKRCTQNIFVPFDRLASFYIFICFPFFFFFFKLILDLLTLCYSINVKDNFSRIRINARVMNQKRYWFDDVYCQKYMLSFVEPSIDYSRGGRYSREMRAGTHRYLHARFLARISRFIKKTYNVGGRRCINKKMITIYTDTTYIRHACICLL